jgi:hypothetical protein
MNPLNVDRGSLTDSLQAGEDLSIFCNDYRPCRIFRDKTEGARCGRAYAGSEVRGT